ncbi:MAG: hypothetical protein KC900_10025 [Candidatus Omnitrophica bacterium]|nr:hypothetical protein [Candidatus Omnitrophota bacterium]
MIRIVHLGTPGLSEEEWSWFEGSVTADQLRQFPVWQCRRRRHHIAVTIGFTIWFYLWTFPL